MMLGLGLGLPFQRPQLGVDIMGLFASGEPGAWYDPSDMSTMFQDAAGTIPVTAVGQPVGLILDKSRRLVLGPEIARPLVAGNWVVTGADATHIATFNNGTLRYQSGTTAPQLIISDPSITVPAGTYLVTVVCSAWVSGGIKVFENTGGVLNIGGVGTFTARITIAAPTNAMNLSRTTANVDLTISSISVKAIAGNHATQATTTKRPLLQQDAGGQLYLKFDGVDDALATGNIDFTSTDKMSVWAGVRKLSDAAVGMVVELSPATFSSNGAFQLSAPGGTGTPSYLSSSRGTVYVSPTATGFVAPISNVLAMSNNIAGDLASLRADGKAAASSTGDQGAGNYGNYPLYIGARNQTAAFFNGHLYGLIVRGAASTDSQVSGVERYLATKTGISL